MQRTPQEAKAVVRSVYGAIAERASPGGCCGSSVSCCGPSGSSSEALGYSKSELAAVPEGADLGLGCGNPQAIAALKPGERVLDLGSGAGFDAFLAARQVGPLGSVIGVDMTPQMIARARANAAKVALSHVEFRLGEIEHLPVADDSIDVVMSNCVINLAPDKPAVFREAFRVLAPGGRLAISDIVAIGDLPAALASDPEAYTGCIAGAAAVADVQAMLTAAGFEHVSISLQGYSRAMVDGWSPGSGAADVIASALIEAVKPAGVKTEVVMSTRNTVASVGPSSAAAPEPCCDTVLLSACCPPEEKPGCCGQTHEAAACGCQANEPATR